MEDPNQEPHPC